MCFNVFYSFIPKQEQACCLIEEFLHSLGSGSQTFPNATFGWTNVKDVANAHVQAFELASASGRYCLVERVENFSELAKILRDMDPTLQIPEK